eukprot:IDg19255t1
MPALSPAVVVLIAIFLKLSYTLRRSIPCCVRRPTWLPSGDKLYFVMLLALSSSLAKGTTGSVKIFRASSVTASANVSIEMSYNAELIGDLWGDL